VITNPEKLSHIPECFKPDVHCIRRIPQEFTLQRSSTSWS
jgi:hypothetical protein